MLDEKPMKQNDVQKLSGHQREQLHEALMDAFRSYGALKQLVNFKLEIHLERITNSQNLPDVAFELIDWADAHGERLAQLIQAAHEENAENRALNDFIKQVWEPLGEQSSSTQTPYQHPDTKNQLKTAQETIEPSSAQESQVKAISQRSKRIRRSNRSGRGSTKQHTKATTATPLHPYLEINASQQQSRLYKYGVQKAHKCVNAAREALQTIIDLMQPEKEIFRDQCQVAVMKLNEAKEAIQEISVELAQVPPSTVSSLYLLENEQTNFIDEVHKAILSLHEFSGQTTSLFLRKKVWDKLHLLLESLPEVDDIIDNFGKNVDKS